MRCCLDNPSLIEAHTSTLTQYSILNCSLSSIFFFIEVKNKMHLTLKPWTPRAVTCTRAHHKRKCWWACAKQSTFRRDVSEALGRSRGWGGLLCNYRHLLNKGSRRVDYIDICGTKCRGGRLSSTHGICWTRRVECFRRPRSQVDRCRGGAIDIFVEHDADGIKYAQTFCLLSLKVRNPGQSIGYSATSRSWRRSL